MSPDVRGPGLLFADDSGGEGDDLRSLAVLSGPAPVLLALERDLRKALDLHGVDELRWAALRTRRERLQAARACLDLLCAGLGLGGLRCDLLLWRPAAQGRAYAARSEAQRLRPLYAWAWTRAAAAWKGLGPWMACPDQRTGMDWGRWSPATRRAWRVAGMAGLEVRELPSARSACVQLADLLAGLARHQERRHGGPAGARAHANRQDLWDHWVRACAARGLRLERRHGAPRARHPRLHVRLLKRLPTRA